MATEYVENRDGDYRVTGTRVSLDSVVYAYLDGQSAESIAQAFPALTLELVHGALAYYLANQAEMDRYLEGRRSDYEQSRTASRQQAPMFYQKLASARQAKQSA